jgi:hypothetical protein
VPRDEFRPHAQESTETERPPHGLRDVERHRPRLATVAAADPLHDHAQPLDALPSDAQPSDAALRRPNSLMPTPTPISPVTGTLPLLTLSRLGTRPSLKLKNARRRPRGLVRCPRQPRQRPTSAAPSCARHQARQLKKRTMKTFPTACDCFVHGSRSFVARVYCDEQYF